MFFSAIVYYIDNDWTVSAEDMILLVLMLGAYFLFLIVYFQKMETAEHSIIRHGDRYIYGRRVEYPYSKISRIFRMFCVYSYLYVIEVDHRGRKIWIIPNLFHKHKEILKTIISKVDRSIVDKDVLNAINM
jgi:hypothetical protein